MLGQEIFFGKGKCAAWHPAPFYLDDKMHDLKVPRFTLDDTVEFFNIVTNLKLTQKEKEALVAFTRQL